MRQEEFWVALGRYTWRRAAGSRSSSPIDFCWGQRSWTHWFSLLIKSCSHLSAVIPFPFICVFARLELHNNGDLCSTTRHSRRIENGFLLPLREMLSKLLPVRHRKLSKSEVPDLHRGWVPSGGRWRPVGSCLNSAMFSLPQKELWRHTGSRASFPADRN